MIKLEKLTKRFSNGRGIFDLNLTIEKGEVFGYLGPNGAGKSTTIRHMLGFLKANSGSATIAGADCWTEAASIQKSVGYLPGEIAFPEGMSGNEFLRFMTGLRKLKDTTKQKELVNRFQFDIKTPIRKMSKGMKQKLAIVIAFMHDPEVLILDEPTSGLDPLMQKTFVDLILEEKNQGKTILMSSHSFAEIEKTCDRIGIIKDGRIVAVEDAQSMQHRQRKIFEVTYSNKSDADNVKASGLNILDQRENTVDILVQGNYDEFLDTINQGKVINIHPREQELEDIFMEYYVQKEGVTQ